MTRPRRPIKGSFPTIAGRSPTCPAPKSWLRLPRGSISGLIEAAGSLLGVMGRQPLGGVTLIRHAYVRPAAQQQGVGAQLLQQLLQGIDAPVLVGTWAAAWWAIRFYEKHGFKLVTPTEKDRLLRRYWTISDRQVETSVVLADAGWFASPLAR